MASAALPFLGVSLASDAWTDATELTFFATAAGLAVFVDLAVGLAPAAVLAALTGFFGAAALIGFFGAAALVGFFDAAALVGFFDAAALVGFFDAAVLVGFFDVADLVGFFDVADLVGFFDAAVLVGFVADVALLRFIGPAADFGVAVLAGAVARWVVAAGLAARAVLAELPVLDPLALLVDLPARVVERAVRLGLGFLVSPRFGM